MSTQQLISECGGYKLTDLTKKYAHQYQSMECCTVSSRESYTALALRFLFMEFALASMSFRSPVAVRRSLTSMSISLSRSLVSNFAWLSPTKSGSDGQLRPRRGRNLSLALNHAHQQSPSRRVPSKELAWDPGSLLIFDGFMGVLFAHSCRTPMRDPPGH